MNLTLLPLPSRLAGSTCTLRPWRRGDGEVLWALVDQDRERLSRWLPWPGHHTCVEDSEEYARRASAEWQLRRQLSAALCLPDGTVVGGAGVAPPDWDQRIFEIGYWISSPWEGGGRVTEAVQLLTALLFERLDARRVVIRCEIDNLRSAAIPRRLGFVHEGTLRHAMRATAGGYADIACFAMLRDDYFDAPWAPDAANVIVAADREG